MMDKLLKINNFRQKKTSGINYNNYLRFILEEFILFRLFSKTRSRSLQSTEPLPASNQPKNGSHCSLYSTEPQTQIITQNSYY